MDYVEPVVTIANCLGTPVCKYWRYHKNLNGYVRNFKMIRDELNSRMEEMEVQLKAELLHSVGKIPKQGVEIWIENVKATINEAQDVETKVSNSRYLCRAWNGKLVEQKTQEMQTILDRTPNASESLIIDDPSAVGLALPTSELVGAKAVRDEIWECLMHEEVSKIGVWGMGGVGKTTIMKHIHNDLLNQRQRFEKVIWVTVSKEFNVAKLQNDIASALDLKGEFPKEGDNLRKAAILSEKLKKAGKHVLILDDVWDKVSLEEVGIPEPSSSNGCKLVLTTRKEQVCKYMGCKVITVKPLSEEEALILFLNKVGPNMVQSQTIMPTLRLVVKECAGLPLTIVVVAGTLKGDDDPRVWRNALKELKDRIGKVEGVEAEVIERLKFSYNHLKDEKVKHCFLYYALYREDFNIEKDELIECWIDEGLIDEMETREDMKDKGYVILKRLEDCCLLENVRSRFNEPAVKMHDAVRDMALSITSMKPRYMIRAGFSLKVFPKEEGWMADVVKVSLMQNSISEIPMEMLPPKCPMLTTLLLQENYFLRMIPDSFFENMPCLSVVNLSNTKIERLPNSISELENLTALLLRECRELRNLPSLSKLQRLKKLDLHRTEIEEVPVGMDMLINLRYLDLGVATSKGIPVGVLPKLSRLQYLMFYLGNEETSVKTEEVVGLEKLERFEGRLKGMHEFNKFVSSMHQQCKKILIKYKLKVGPYGFGSTRDKSVAISGVKFCEGDELIKLPTDIQAFNMNRCNGREHIVSFPSSSTTHPWTQSLEELVLYDITDLSQLIKVEGLSPPPSATFSHLNRISIDRCNRMKTLLPHWLLPNLKNLERIVVRDCDGLVEILGAAPSPTLEDEEEKKKQ